MTRNFGIFILVSLIAVTIGAPAKPSELASASVFHDAEPLVGRVGAQYDGGKPNHVFRLAAMPKPEASLILVSDGRVLTQGLDYALRNDGMVQITEYAPKRTLQAWYRADK